MRVETVARLLAAAGVHWLRFEFADTLGVARSKVVPLSRLERVGTRGLRFYGGTDGRASNNAAPAPDFILMPDFDTLALLPYAPGEARVICELYDLNQEPAPHDGRWVLQQVVEQYLDEGLLPATTFAFDFYVIERETGAPAFPGGRPGASVRNAARPAWRDTLLSALPSLGVELESINTAGAPGQVHAELATARGVAAADQAFTFRTAVKEVANQDELTATFMTRPPCGDVASACIMQHRLLDAVTGENRFADDEDPLGISPIAKHFVAGLLYHAAALSAFLLPIPNDYKRYHAAGCVPQHATWSCESRAAAVRVPARPGADAAQVENRIAAASANPYIALAACLAAGLDGLRQRMLPPAPLHGDPTARNGAPRLPRSLDEALAALEADTPLHALLGEPFIRTYLGVARFEIARTRLACPGYGTEEWERRVDPWEWSEYGELL